MITKTLSTKNPYRLERNRYLELKYFCFQYEKWKKELGDLLYLKELKSSEIKSTCTSDPTADLAIKRAELLSKCEMIEQSAIEAAPGFYQGLIKGVTHNIGYDSLIANEALDISQREYYVCYRRFFWILDRKRR